MSRHRRRFQTIKILSQNSDDRGSKASLPRSQNWPQSEVGAGRLPLLLRRREEVKLRRSTQLHLLNGLMMWFQEIKDFALLSVARISELINLFRWRAGHGIEHLIILHHRAHHSSTGLPRERYLSYLAFGALWFWPVFLKNLLFQFQRRFRWHGYSSGSVN